MLTSETPMLPARDYSPATGTEGESDENTSSFPAHQGAGIPELAK
jgi:hypothetical protein